MSAVRIRGKGLLPFLVFVVAWISRHAFTQADSVRHQRNLGELLPWSSEDTWDDGIVPLKNAQVVIKTGMHVLLDDQPAPLRSLTIEANASLTWDNVSNLELRAEYIVVDGEFHMGSETSPLLQPAAIKLTGRSDSTFKVFDGGDDVNKVLVVRQGGTLEIHGQRKTSWTRLAQSIPAIFDLSCTFVYNHSDHEVYPFTKDHSSGLHVIVWNEDGTVFDFSIFQVFTTLREFVAGIPAGKVIGMTAYAREGLGRRGKPRRDFPTLDDVIINDLGGSLISNVTRSDSYSLLTRKGFNNSTTEYHKTRGRIRVEEEENYLQLPIWETNMTFQVATSAKTTHEYFRVVPTEVAYPILELAENITGWSPGDKIVVASTDFDWKQAEVREIVDCRGHCSASQIRVNGSFSYRHYGNFTYNVDERAEVGLLSRNIVIEGVMEDECYSTNDKEEKLCKRFGRDTFGGHIKIVRGFESVHVEGVELFHMGQQAKMGAYPFHFHMCDEAPGAWLKDSSIHHSFSRCVTIHGTDKLEVSGNVCYDHLGHGYFLEDSVEQDNVLNGNLGIGTRHGMLLMSDSDRDWCRKDYGRRFVENCGDTATFWLTHPNNDVSNNAAAGGDGHGFMYVFGEMPLGPSYERQLVLGKVTRYSARSTPIKRFYNNVAHSYFKSGIFIDSQISTGKFKSEKRVPENGIIQDENYFEPRDPPGDPNGQRVWTKLERNTAYKNRQNNMWIKGGNLNVTFSSQADSMSQSFSGGCTGLQTGVSVEYSILIGRSDNLGQPRLYMETLPNGDTLTNHFERNYGGSPWKTVTGVGIYQGPMYVKHTYFDRFNTIYWNDSWTEKLGKRPVSNAGAISFKKDGTYPTYTSQYTTNLTFGYCDNVNNGHWLFFGDPSEVWDWKDTDGLKNAHNSDRDGSLTGTPNTYIVRNRPFFTGPECLYRPDWDMSVCPYRYIKMEFLGKGGSLSIDKKDKWPLIAYRDDVPGDPLTQEGTQRREYLARVYSSYLIDFNTTLNGAAFPDEIKVQGNGVEKQDVVRVGICMPLDLTEFEIHSIYPVRIRRNNFTRVYSMEDLDADEGNITIYHDTENGIIFFKIWSRHDRTNDSQLCPAGHCFNLRIVLLNGDRSNIRSCFGAEYPAFQDPRPRPPKPELKPCPGIASPAGLGAVRYDEVKKIVHEDYHVPCAAPPSELEEPDPTAYVGCFVKGTQAFEQLQQSRLAMTIQWCISRCYQRSFKYAGLIRGSFCSCAQTVNDSEEAQNIKNTDCTKPCTGDNNQECGNGGRIAVWATGL